jgi:DNA-binding transcriptional ArsR family regulator
LRADGAGVEAEWWARLVALGARSCIVHLLVNNHAILDRGFLALSHPVRRAIVERLVDGPASVGAASRGLGVSKPAVTKHLKVLEGAGVVSRAVNGRTHVLRLEPRALREVSDWLELHRSLWERKFEAVERHLTESNRQEVRG